MVLIKVCQALQPTFGLLLLHDTAGSGNPALARYAAARHVPNGAGLRHSALRPEGVSRRGALGHVRTTGAVLRLSCCMGHDINPPFFRLHQCQH